MSWLWPVTTVTPSWWSQPWDAGINWFSRLITPPEDDPLTVAYVRDKVLRVVNADVEDQYIEMLIKGATRAAEERTQRALMPQTWAIVLDGFPSGAIELPRPPLIDVTAFGYLDENGDSQTLALSPLDFQVIPSGAYTKAKVKALSGADWPTSGAYGEAVTIEFQAGYANGEVDPEILAGMCLWIGEMYKQRSLSVQAMSGSAPSQLQLDQFWRKVY